MFRDGRLDAGVEQQGFRIVLVLRRSPLFPFALLNYALGATRVRLHDYLLGPWLGMLPATGRRGGRRHAHGRAALTRSLEGH